MEKRLKTRHCVPPNYVRNLHVHIHEVARKFDNLIVFRGRNDVVLVLVATILSNMETI